MPFHISAVYSMTNSSLLHRKGLTYNSKTTIQLGQPTSVRPAVRLGCRSQTDACPPDSLWVEPSICHIQPALMTLQAHT